MTATTSKDEALVKAIAVALEITRSQLSDGAMMFMLSELRTFPYEQVEGALRRCCRELKQGQFTLEAVLSRLDDGRPSPEEAWASIPKDEEGSVVWTEEMRAAWASARPLLLEGEVVQARMAFLDAYRRLTREAREARAPVEWSFSPGYNRDCRELVLLDAAEKGRLSTEAVKRLLPYHRQDEVLNARLLAIAGRALKRIEGPDGR